MSGDNAPVVRSYRDLIAWQKAMELSVDCYRLTRSFPDEERFGLSAQIRRASSSLAANIAEGQGRETTGAFVQFLRIAQGSLKELETHIILSNRVGILHGQACERVLKQCDELGRVLRGLIRSLQSRTED